MFGDTAGTGTASANGLKAPATVIATATANSVKALETVAVTATADNLKALETVAVTATADNLKAPTRSTVRASLRASASVLVRFAHEDVGLRCLRRPGRVERVAPFIPTRTD